MFLNHSFLIEVLRYPDEKFASRLSKSNVDQSESQQFFCFKMDSIFLKTYSIPTRQFAQEILPLYYS